MAEGLSREEKGKRQVTEEGTHAEGATQETPKQPSAIDVEEMRAVQDAYDTAYEAALAAIRAYPHASHQHRQQQSPASAQASPAQPSHSSAQNPNPHALRFTQRNRRQTIQSNNNNNRNHNNDNNVAAAALHNNAENNGNIARVRVIRIDVRLLLKIMLVATLLAQNGSWVHRAAIFAFAVALYAAIVGALPASQRVKNLLHNSWYATMSRFMSSARRARHGSILGQYECFILGMTLSLFPAFQLPSENGQQEAQQRQDQQRDPGQRQNNQQEREQRAGQAAAGAGYR